MRFHNLMCSRNLVGEISEVPIGENAFNVSRLPTRLVHLILISHRSHRVSAAPEELRTNHHPDDVLPVGIMTSRLDFLEDHMARPNPMWLVSKLVATTWTSNVGPHLPPNLDQVKALELPKRLPHLTILEHRKMPKSSSASCCLFCSADFHWPTGTE
jgi:hypothetical protein